MRGEFGSAATRELFLDWMMLAEIPGSATCPGGKTPDQSADEGTLVEVLQVADASQAPAICQVFEDRLIEASDPNLCPDSAGWICYADCDDSGELTFFDFLCFQNLFAAMDPGADCDGDGVFTFFDSLCFQNAFVGGCP